MKKVLLSLAALALLAGAVEAKSFNVKLHDECLYVLGDRDAGRYDEEAHGFTLGVVAGVKAMTPRGKRTQMFRKSLGYISDRACLRALRSKSHESFVHKYERAVLKLLVR